MATLRQTRIAYVDGRFVPETELAWTPEATGDRTQCRGARARFAGTINHQPTLPPPPIAQPGWVQFRTGRSPSRG